MVIPSSWPYRRLLPWGSNPLIDALWSNGPLEFLHDGAEASRMDKLRFVCRMPSAMRHLRVCPDFTRGAYNCGECEKCRRTLLALRLLGVSDSALPFSKPLDLRAFELDPPQPYLRPLYQDIMAEAVERNDAELIRWLRVLTGQAWSPRLKWHRLRSRIKRALRNYTPKTSA